MKKQKLDHDKLQEEKDAIARTYTDYITTFQQTSMLAPKTFVKSSTLYEDQNGGSNRKGEFYTPKVLIPISKPANKVSNPGNVYKPQNFKGKKSSNLEILGNELKIIHMERMLNKKDSTSTFPKVLNVAKPNKCLMLPGPSTTTSNVNEDPSDYSNSTNLFITCLKSDFTEKKLIQVFGVYGPLASVKILWPRAEEKICRSFNCGFVAFMSRKDAERALNYAQERNDMKVSWGKGVKLPIFPIFIPQDLRKLYAPPPPSGLPFNAQIVHSRDSKYGFLYNTVVKVTIPLDRNLLMQINRMVEFVVREGPEFEAIIMMKQRNNPDFDFLRDFQSPAHVYYRWKLYSILFGDSKAFWPMSPFRMFVGGSIWIPPTAHNFTNGMPKELYEEKHQPKLVETEKNHLVLIIRNLSLSKRSIARAMAFCLENEKSLCDVLRVLFDSFRNPYTKPLKKLARLFLLSDILHNCKNRGIKVKGLNDKFNNSKICTEVFQRLHETRKSLKNESERENFQIKVLKVLRSWIGFHVFDINYLTKLENLFFTGSDGAIIPDEVMEMDGASSSYTEESQDGYNLFKDEHHDGTTLDNALFDDSKEFSSIKRKTTERNFDMFCPYDLSESFILK